MSFRICLVQMKVVGGDVEANLERAEHLVQEAADEGAQLVVLPEAVDLGWTHPFALSQVGPIPEGDTCQRLCELARRQVVYLCAGIIERDGDATYNAAVLIGPSGDVLLKYRKLNQLEIEHEFYALGDALGVVETPLGTIGMLICSDGFAAGQSLTRSLAYMEPQVILVPSSWAVPPDHDNDMVPYGSLWTDNFGPPARHFQLWIAGVSNVGKMTDGPWKGMQCIGCSMIVGPDGEQLLQARYGEDAQTLVFADIAPVPRHARGTLWEQVQRT